MNVTDATIRVLVVDDEPTFAELIERMLEREDERFEVRTATSVEEGLEALENTRIDCVVSDYGMPMTDGLEFLEEIRTEYGDVPFVLLTGKGDEEIASDAISAGVTDYLRKQEGTEQYSLLANRLVDAVEKRRTRRALERRKRELETLNQRFQSFVRHSPDIITVFGSDGTIQYNSPAIEHVLGYDQDDLVGEQALDYVHPDDHAHILTAFERLSDATGESRESFEWRGRHADDSWLWLESIVSNRTGTTGGGYLMSTREITERKERERELQAKSERLEEFAGIVSHDLQTPITVADARLELAMEECDSEHLQPIGDALDRMDEIIDATLALAREGQVVDETEPVDLVDAADRWWQTIEHQDATLEIDADELTVAADRERLRRVMENLFANAVDHGGPDVTVTIGELEDGLYVADDGPGIPEDMGEEIFEPGRSMSPDGNGFGLAIVEEIVNAHGWEIEAGDHETGGARFEITGVERVPPS